MFTILDYSSALEYSNIRRYTTIVYYYYIIIIKIGTKFNMVHHIKIPTISSNIGFIIVHTGPCNTNNTS